MENKGVWETVLEVASQQLGAPDYELTVYSFPQVWGSTAGGFGGIGGQMITSSQTFVVIDYASHKAAVFFGRKLAYVVPLTESVRQAIANQKMPAVNQVSFLLAENMNGTSGSA